MKLTFKLILEILFRTNTFRAVLASLPLPLKLAPALPLPMPHNLTPALPLPHSGPLSSKMAHVIMSFNNFFVTYFENYDPPECVSNRSSSEKNSILPILVCQSLMVSDHFYPKSSSHSNSKKNYFGQNNQCRKLKIAPTVQKFSVVYKTYSNKGFFHEQLS